MKIETIKDLEAVIALCRKRGVLSIEVDNIKLELSEKAPTKAKKKLKTETSDRVEMDAEYSDEDIAMWSANGALNG